MTLTIDLSPEEESRVANARECGIDIDAIVHGLIKGLPEPPASENGYRPGQRTIELLERWAREDATDDPEELERRDRVTEELIANLRANRVNFPMPQL